MARMVQHWSWENQPHSVGLADVIVTGIDKCGACGPSASMPCSVADPSSCLCPRIRADSDNVPAWFKLVEPFVQIADSLQGARVQRLFNADKGLFYLVSYSKHSNPRFTYAVLKLMLPIIERNAAVQQYLVSTACLPDCRLLVLGS